MDKTKIKVLYHMTELIDLLNQLSVNEKKSLQKESVYNEFKNCYRDWIDTDISGKNIRKGINSKFHIEDYDFEKVMNNIRNSFTHNKLTPDDDLQSIDWLLIILLKNKTLFSNVSDADTFLSNITGLTHKTKSTGRDRIVNWYFKEIDKKYNESKKNDIYYKILKYIFINYSSNYKEWARLLQNIKG